MKWKKEKKPLGITINLFVTLESVLFVVGRGCSSIANIFLVLGGLSCCIGCKFLMNLKILNKNVCIRAKISHISHALWFPTNNVIPQYFSIISSISLLYQFIIPSLMLLTPWSDIYWREAIDKKRYDYSENQQYQNDWIFFND